MYSEQDLIAKGRSLGISEREIKIISKIYNCETLDYYIYAYECGFRGEDIDSILKWVSKAEHYLRKSAKKFLSDYSEDDKRFQYTIDKYESQKMHEDLKREVIKKTAITIKYKDMKAVLTDDVLDRLADIE